MKLRFFLLLFFLLGLSACSTITTNPVEYFKTDDAVDWRTGDFHVDGLEFRIMKRGEGYFVNPAWVGNEEGWSPLIATEKGWVTNAVGQGGFSRIDFHDISSPQLEFFKDAKGPLHLKFLTPTKTMKLSRVKFVDDSKLTEKRIKILEEVVSMHPDRARVYDLFNAPRNENSIPHMITSKEASESIGLDRLSSTVFFLDWQPSNENFEIEFKYQKGAHYAWCAGNLLAIHTTLVRLRDITLERWDESKSGGFSGSFKFSNHFVSGRCLFSGKGDKIELMSFARKRSDKLTDGYPIRGDNFGRKLRYNALSGLLNNSDCPQVASGEFYEVKPPGLYVVESSDYCDDSHLLKFSIKLMEHQKAHEAQSPRILLACRTSELTKVREKLKPLCAAAGLPMWHLALTDGTGEDIKGIPVMVPD